VLLKNMFRVEEETEPEWWLDIAEDVGEECETHGAVKHVFVDRESFGFVYLKFGTIAAAEGAKKALHGRWFAGRTVSAEYQFTAVYDRHFNA
jgi:RNA-binding protein 39